MRPPAATDAVAAPVAATATPPALALTTFRASIRLLLTRRFGTFWIASLLSSIGTWAQQVAEPWLLLTIGASSFMVGLDSFAATAPAWLLTILGGAMADRGDRRRIIARLQSVQMLCPIAIIVLIATGMVRPWMIISLSVVVGVTDALSMPSFQSIVPTIVSRADIPYGLALNSTQFNLSRIIGPSIAGLLMAGAGLTACFAISAASYIPFIAVALWILPSRRRTYPGTERAPFRPFAEIRRIVHQPVVRGALWAVLTTSALCSPLVVFVPVLVRDGFHGGGTEFSAAVASFGLGGLGGALALLSVGPSIDRRRVSAYAAMSYGVVILLAASTPWVWSLPILLVIAGAAMTVTNTAANTLVQSSAAPHLLGQTVSVYMFMMSAGISVGALLTGLLVTMLGVRTALAINGAAAIAIHAVNASVWFRATVRTEPAAAS